MKRVIITVLLSAALSMFVGGCGLFSLSAKNESSLGSNKREEKTIRYLTTARGGAAKVIEDLSKEYEKTDSMVNFRFETVAQVDLRQRVQLLAASNDLPTLFSFESGRPLQNMLNEVLDLEKTFKELDIYDKLNPAAVKLLKEQIRGGGLYALPLEMNIEGFWYNKKIFADNNLSEPTTWDDMLKAADILKQQGIQAYAVAGKDKWPITRYIGSYVIRKYGPNVMDRVSKGEIKVTSPGFIEAAQVVQKMNNEGYFGSNVNTVDIKSAKDMFFQSKAAMIYTGSWELRDFNNPVINKIGTENIGFFNIPLVKDGMGTLDDYAMNTGLTTSFSKAAYDSTVGDWMKAVFSSYGDRAMNDLGMITGFKVETMPKEVPPLTQMVQKRFDSAKRGALWFEAFFDSKTQLTAWDNAQLLVAGSTYSPEMYMFKLQNALDEQYQK
ncbi:extracellular solute-binding protein [Paenibacillus sp. LjRoot153]|uniref:ABC transporter substrate-binding protein n=1 Tax=Paenibacillus sp. LjRoot153 TaxID=3342270 RepID=UPI003ECC577A